LLGDAANGGSILLRLRGTLEATLAKQKDGPFRCFENLLTANAGTLELKAVQVDCKGRYDFNEWDTSTTAVHFRGQPIGQLTFRSGRRGFDIAAVSGGRCTNRWNLPRRADGAPFAF